MVMTDCVCYVLSCLGAVIRFICGNDRMSLLCFVMSRCCNKVHMW